MSFLGSRAATEVASWNWTGHSEGPSHCDLAGEQSITKTLPAVSVYEVISTGHTPRAKTAQNAHRHVLVLSRLLAPKKCPHKTISGGMFQSSLIPRLRPCTRAWNNIRSFEYKFSSFIPRLSLSSAFDYFPSFLHVTSYWKLHALGLTLVVHRSSGLNYSATTKLIIIPFCTLDRMVRSRGGLLCQQILPPVPRSWRRLSWNLWEREAYWRTMLWSGGSLWNLKERLLLYCDLCTLTL